MPPPRPSSICRPPRAVAQVIDTTYPGPAGDQNIRLYIPDAPGPLPVVVYFHGGGFVTGDLAVTEELCRALANDAGAIVAAVSYRLAPEHPFPAATDDTFAALQWVADNAVQFGGDPTRIAVHGDSAGGNLAAVAALRARDEGGPALTCQVLTYPVIDPHADTPSREQYGEGYIITAAGLDWFWNQYLETLRTPRTRWRCPRRPPPSPGCPRPSSCPWSTRSPATRPRRTASSSPTPASRPRSSASTDLSTGCTGSPAQSPRHRNPLRRAEFLTRNSPSNPSQR